VKIEFGTAILADEDAEDGIIASLEIAGERVIEEARFVRASFIEIFDRYNESSAVAVQVIRLHADRQAAQLFLLEHMGTLPGVADLAITASDLSGNVVVRWLKDAGLPSKTSGVIIGMTTVHTYRFIGGEVTKSI
jgi:hypothetical protein